MLNKVNEKEYRCGMNQSVIQNLSLLFVFLALVLVITGCLRSSPTVVTDLPADVEPSSTGEIDTDEQMSLFCEEWPSCSKDFWQNVNEAQIAAQLDGGSDVNASDMDNWTPLHFAAS